jgi:hypothetical protein
VGVSAGDLANGASGAFRSTWKSTKEDEHLKNEPLKPPPPTIINTTNHQPPQPEEGN